MRPLTRFTNKHLIPVYLRPMIEYPLGTLLNLGLSDLLVVTGRRHLGQIVEVLGSGSEYGEGVTLSYRVQEQARGIADALLLAEDFAAGRKLAVILGDNVFDDDALPGALEAFAKARPPHALNFLAEVADPRAYGVAEIEGERIVRIQEKPTQPASHLAVTGLYLYPPDVFEILPTLTPSARGELEISDVNNAYAKAGRLRFERVACWFDAGEPEPWMRAQTYVARHPQRFGAARFGLGSR